MIKSVKSVLYQYKQKQLLSKLNKQAHLRVLSDQLSPHFVFNALNNLRFMLLLDATRAKQMALDISDIVEDMELVQREQKISLQDELALLSKYLRLIGIQLGDGFQLKLQVSSSLSVNHLKELQVLPMVLQLMGENSVKHGLSLMHSGFLLVQVRLYRGYVIYRVSNTTPDNIKSKNTIREESNSYSIGINNIRQRLTVLYPEQHIYRFRKRKYASTLIIFPVQIQSTAPGVASNES